MKNFYSTQNHLCHLIVIYISIDYEIIRRITHDFKRIFFVATSFLSFCFLCRNSYFHFEVRHVFGRTNYVKVWFWNKKTLVLIFKKTAFSSFRFEKPSPDYFLQLHKNKRKLSFNLFFIFYFLMTFCMIAVEIVYDINVYDRISYHLLFKIKAHETSVVNKVKYHYFLRRQIFINLTIKEKNSGS